MNSLFPIFVIVISLFSTSLSAQTVGALVNSPNSYEGYTFFSPTAGTNAYLVDNCGRLINRWERSNKPGLAAYFLENGTMLRTYQASPVVGPFNSYSNAGGLEIVDWDNNTIWSFEINTATWLSHHDAVMMPNGNILILTWDIISDDDLIQEGRDPNEIAPQGYAWNERIIEVEPVGSNGANILWEWKIRDHYIQDFDATKDNYGVVSEHPELFNINLPDINSINSHSDFDYNHFNSIDYNADLDQILISARNSDEIWILDHSTTTTEAAGHTGGQSGKGGDILYRYGNANAYDRGEVSEQVLFGQHGVNWIPEGSPDAGKIMIYNNGNGRPGQNYSEAEIINPPTDGSGNYVVPATDPFGPSEAEWSYGNLGSEYFYSAFFSNAHRLPNGNTLINAGGGGEIIEIDSNKDVVWNYVIPLIGNNPVTQGSNSGGNGTFRAYRYGLDYPGFAGKDLSPGDLIEIDPSPPPCILVNTKTLPAQEVQYTMDFDPTISAIIIDNPGNSNLTIAVFSVDGKQILAPQSIVGSSRIPLHIDQSGLFIIQGIDENGMIKGKKFTLTR